MPFKVGDHVKAIAKIVGGNKKHLTYATGIHGTITDITDDRVAVALDAPTLAGLTVGDILECDDKGYSIVEYVFRAEELTSAPARGTVAERKAQVERVERVLGLSNEELLDLIEQKSEKIQQLLVDGLVLKLRIDKPDLDAAAIDEAKADFRFFSDTMRDYYGTPMAEDWLPDDVCSLLTQYIPAKYMADERTIQTLAEHIVYAVDAAAYLEALPHWRRKDFIAVKAAAARTAELSADSDNWGISRRLVSGMSTDGVDFSKQTEVDAWIQNFNKRQIGDRDRIFRDKASPNKPVRSAKKYGRNERVTVVYSDGRRKEGVKYKTVMEDLAGGFCKLVTG